MKSFSYGSLRWRISNLEGSVFIKLQEILVSFKLKKFIYLNTIKHGKWGLSFDHKVINKLQERVDFTVIFPEFLDSHRKDEFLRLAKKLSKSHKILVYDVLPEIGGGGGRGKEVVETIRDAWTHVDSLQPYFVLGYDLVAGFIGSLIYGLYKEKHNSITKSQFQIRRVHKSIEYHYIFDNLNFEDAVAAAKLIPEETSREIPGVHPMYEQVYLKFLPKKKSWIRINS